MEKPSEKHQQYEAKYRGLQPDKRAASNLPALGHKLPASFRNVDEARNGIIHVRTEFWRLEKTVALIYDPTVVTQLEVVSTSSTHILCCREA